MLLVSENKKKEMIGFSFFPFKSSGVSFLSPALLGRNLSKKSGIFLFGFWNGGSGEGGGEHVCGLKCDRYTMHAFNINIVALNVDVKLVSVCLPCFFC